MFNSVVIYRDEFLFACVLKFPEHVHARIKVVYIALDKCISESMEHYKEVLINAKDTTKELRDTAQELRECIKDLEKIANDLEKKASDCEDNTEKLIRSMNLIKKLMKPLK